MSTIYKNSSNEEIRSFVNSMFFDERSNETIQNLAIVILVLLDRIEELSKRVPS